MEEITALFQKIIEKQALTKIIYSKPANKEIQKAWGHIILLKNVRTLQTETFMKDGKAIHSNIEEANALPFLEQQLSSYRQINIFTSSGEAEIKISSKGKMFLINHIHFEDLQQSVAGSNNKKRNYIIDPVEASSFLSKLGVTSEKGEIYDKKRSKFKQINRFVEILDSVYPNLPSDGVLTVCDFCCGKSYLTFAVYYYLTVLQKREVCMYGVDLKKDVIEDCSHLAKQLHFDGLSFFAEDIRRFKVPSPPSLVVSLHACDIATDIVLSNAVRLGARVILSTPCCHHEVMNHLNSKELHFVTRHSMLRQKLADSVTDAMRLSLLEYKGYKVSAVELIDPEETPKNIMLKAIYKNTSKEKREAALQEYRNAKALLGCGISLEKYYLEDEYNEKVLLPDGSTKL